MSLNRVRGRATCPAVCVSCLAPGRVERVLLLASCRAVILAAVVFCIGYAGFAVFSVSNKGVAVESAPSNKGRTLAVSPG